MKESGYYPAGAEHDPNAPYNQVSNPEREIEVTVSITLSKTVKVNVSDYEIIDSGRDEDGDYFENIDYSNCDLKGAVKKQVVLPNEAYKFLNPHPFNKNEIFKDLSDWNVDDFECIMEE